MLALLEAVAGVASHLLYFTHGEHHMKAPVLFYSYSCLTFAVFIYELQTNDHVFYRAVQITTVHVCAYIIPLFTSIVIYRAYFHRLRSFPGPFLAGVSKLWHVYQVRYSRNHQLMLELHKQYGSFVRTGPCEITAFVPHAMSALNEPNSICSKPAWYDLLEPMRALISTRDKSEHDRRRRIWDKGFSTKALQCYDERIVKYVDQLDEIIAENTNQPVLVNEWFRWFGFDVMGDLTLGKSFGMLNEQKWHHALLMMRDFMWLLGPFTPTPWLVRLGFGIPGLARGWKKWALWCKERMSERILTEPEKPDVSSHLIKASQENDSLEQDRLWLYGDAVTLITAGSDSVSITLTFAFYHLARFPFYQDRICDELSKAASITDLQHLSQLPVLQSVITETLRLFPPIPTGAPRESGPDGIVIEGQYIPPYTTILAPHYVIARLESAFERAEEFIPERWTSKPEMVLDKRAFAPFSQGRYGCVGKHLALREVSYVIALILSKYQVKLAPGEDPSRVEKDMKDAFTAVPGKVYLVFEKRGK